jgi:hypothetical protein
MRGNLTLCNDMKGQQYFVQAIQKKFDEIFDIWALSVSLLLLYAAYEALSNSFPKSTHSNIMSKWTPKRKGF